MANNKLLEEFPPVTTQAWEEAIAKDLKGADYEKKLIWRTPAGMPVRPYYRAEDTAGLDWARTVPGAFPYLRGTRAQAGWRIREVIDLPDAVAANRAARAAVAAGAEEISFGKISVGNVSDVTVLLAELDSVPVLLACPDGRFMRRLLAYLAKAKRTAPVATTFEPLSDLDCAVQTAHSAPPGMTPFMINDARLEDAYATAAQEIGFALANGVDYLAAMTERGVDVVRAASLLHFGFGVGANFFFEISKLRALRMLWARVVESFGAPPEACTAHIAARTARWNKTVYDPHVNVLRATTEAMAAVLGGADSVTVAAFDECYRRPDEASRRLARNTQILLKHESMLAQVADPGGGAYAIEAITAYLAEEGWKLMQEVESRGGYRQAREWIGQKIDESVATRESRVADRSRVFVGTNQFANSAERALERIEPVRFAAGRRATRFYEELRLKTERSGKTPRILLAEIGDAKMRAARSGFAANFFACAGFSVPVQRFATAAEIASAEGDAIVLCSSDREYAALVAELIPKLRAIGRATPVIVAGNPENAEELRAAGVADFIHVKSNTLGVLAGWQQRLGVRG